MEKSDKINCNTCEHKDVNEDNEPCISCIDSPCNHCNKKSILRNWKPKKKTNWAIVRLLKLMSVPEQSREMIALSLKSIDKMIDSIE